MWLMYECSDDNVTEFKKFYDTELSEEEKKKVFVPTYDCMKKYQGSWHMEQKPIFADCLVIDCKDKKELQDTLTGQQWPQVLAEDIISGAKALQPEQEAFLKGLMQPDTKRITMSTGYIKDGITYVTEGPLLGREKFIRKIDRHKRLAWLMIPAGNSLWKMSAGLEIVSKN